MSTRREEVERIWRRHQGDHQGRHLADWAKRGNTRRERKRRWATIAEFAKDHALSKKDAGEYRKAHRFRLLRQWARAKVRQLKRRIRRDRPDPTPPGPSTGAWGGSQAAGEAAVVRNASAYGVWISSRKRSRTDPLSISNPSSDHNEANTTAYAWDIATFSGESVARAIARDLGIGNWSPGNYNSYTIQRAWGTFRVQILWAVSGHYNHVHVGIRRA